MNRIKHKKIIAAVVIFLLVAAAFYIKSGRNITGGFRIPR